MQDLAHVLFSELIRCNVEYIYQGNFTTTITDTILSFAESKFNHDEIENKLRKKVYFIMLEGLQNVTRHQETVVNLNEKIKYSGFFAMQQSVDGYYITTGNTVSQEAIEIITNQIETINKLEKNKLKEYSLKVLDEGKLSHKGGAGLGLIQMARKSGNKLYYRFKKIDENLHFFYLHTSVSNKKDKPEIDRYPKLDNLIKLHQTFADENIILNFIGIFTQKILINLLQIIRTQLKNTRLMTRVSNLMVEVMQNIVKHADKYLMNGETERYAIFYMSEETELLQICSGNYVHKNKIRRLQKRIDFINKLNKQELENLYQKNLFNFHRNTDAHTGLGLIEMRRKCEGKIEYAINQIDDDFYFFSLKIKIRKNK